MEHYAFALTERLGYKTVKELYETMDADEFTAWLAYDKSNDEDFRKKVLEELEEERQLKLSVKERFNQMKMMFKAIAKTPKVEILKPNGK